MYVCRIAAFAASAIFPCLTAAQSLTIQSGVVDDQVFQRDANGIASVSLAGSARGLNGRQLETRALGASGPLANLDWSPSGNVQGDRWSLTLRLPSGGPYRLEVRAGEAMAAVHGILVGDLWVLAGQSNMEGVGDLADVQQPSGLVHSFDMADRWVLAEEPLHLLVGAADRVHWRRNSQNQPERYQGPTLSDFIRSRRKGAGMGLPFAVEMVRRTGVPIGLVPCAHGGTSMDQWNPELGDRGGDSLYGATIRRIRDAGGRIRGILWYQGESDANAKAAPEFQSKFERLIAAFRADTGQPDLPFYYVQIGRHVNQSNVSEWNAVQESQGKAESAVPRSAMAAAVDLSLDDGIHVGTRDLKLLGRRMANLACPDLFPQVAECAGLKRGPRPLAASLAGGIVRVEFAQVNGKLTSQGRISGFSIHDSSAVAVPVIYRAERDPSSPHVILLHIQGKLPEGASLRYGAGKDPYCNVRDDAGMALPAFGPIPIGGR